MSTTVFSKPDVFRAFGLDDAPLADKALVLVEARGRSEPVEALISTVRRDHGLTGGLVQVLGR